MVGKITPASVKGSKRETDKGPIVPLKPKHISAALNVPPMRELYQSCPEMAETAAGRG